MRDLKINGRIIKYINPVQVSGMSANNVLGWEIFLKFYKCLRSYTSWPNPYFWDILSPVHSQQTYQTHEGVYSINITSRSSQFTAKVIITSHISPCIRQTSTVIFPRSSTDKQPVSHAWSNFHRLPGTEVHWNLHPWWAVLCTAHMIALSSV